jgi:sugar lactone lactonase YvrE
MTSTARFDMFTPLIEGLSFAEAPRWHDGRLWIADMYTHRVLAIGLDGRAETVVDVPQQPSGMGWLPDGRLLVVSMRDRKILRREPDGTLAEHADLFHLAPWHLNDMVVDAKGRAYVGNAGFDFMAGSDITLTNVIRVDPDGSATVVADGLGCPNGMVITPDGATLVVAESLCNRLSAFSIDAEGALSDRRTWAAFGDPPATPNLADALALVEAVPDGMCLDAEGAIWVADPFHARVLRVAEGGAILEERQGPMGLFACMLGGEHGTSLFLCAAPSFHEEEAARDHRATVLMTEVDVPRAGLP